MSENPIEIQIKKLEERRVKDEAKLKRLRAKNRKTQRAADTRRKILLGSLLMNLMEDKKTLENIYPRLMKYLERDQDKKLFNEKWLSHRYPSSKNQRNPSKTK